MAAVGPDGFQQQPLADYVAACSLVVIEVNAALPPRTTEVRIEVSIRPTSRVVFVSTYPGRRPECDERAKAAEVRVGDGVCWRHLVHVEKSSCDLHDASAELAPSRGLTVWSAECRQTATRTNDE